MFLTSMLVECLKKWGLNMWCYITLYRNFPRGTTPNRCAVLLLPKMKPFREHVFSFKENPSHYRWARSSNIHPIATSWAIMGLKVDQKAITYWRNVEKRSILCPWLKHSGRKLNHRMLSFGKSMRSIWTIEYCHCSWLMRFIQSPRLNNTMT